MEPIKTFKTLDEVLAKESPDWQQRIIEAGDKLARERDARIDAAKGHESNEAWARKVSGELLATLTPALENVLLEIFRTCERAGAALLIQCEETGAQALVKFHDGKLQVTPGGEENHG